MYAHFYAKSFKFYENFNKICRIVTNQKMQVRFQ